MQLLSTTAPPIFQAGTPRAPATKRQRSLSSENLRLQNPLHHARRVYDAIVPYMLLIRFYLHVNYNVVVIGSVFFPGPSIPVLERVADLIKMYLCFNVCLYGGIYTMNAVTDADEDACHPTKRTRPIPSGAVSKVAATVWSLVLMGSGFLFSYALHGTRFFGIFCAFVAINVGYSYVFRNVRYSRFFTASFTSPTRLLLGAMLSRASVTPESFVMAYLFMVGAHSSKIRAEYNLRDKAADGFRPFVLEAFTFSATGACIWYNLSGLSGAPNPMFCLAVVLANLVFVLGCGYSSTMAGLMYYKGGTLEAAKKSD